MPHSIRLRGPWQCQPLARIISPVGGKLELSTNDLPPAGVLSLPGDWTALLGPAFGGLVRLSRHFNKPTGLSASGRVWLVVEDVTGRAAISLNERLLGTIEGGTAPAAVFADAPEHLRSFLQAAAVPCPARFEIAELREPRNEIAIELFALQMGGLGLVRLEIDD